MTLVHALATGFRRTNASVRMIGLLYLINLCAALPFAWSFHAGASSALDGSMLPARLAEGFDFTAFSGSLAAMKNTLPTLFTTIFPFSLLYLILGTFLGGGILTRLREPGLPLSMRTFFGSCGHYWMRFVRLLLIIGAFLLVIGLPLLLILSWLLATVGESATSEIPAIIGFFIVVLLMAFFTMVVLMVGDYARVFTVLYGGDGMGRTAWRSVRFIFRHIVSTLSLQLLLLLPLALFVVIYLLLEGAVGMITPGRIVVVFLLQQLFIGSRVWSHVFTRASQVNLVERMEGMHEEPVTVPGSASPGSLPGG